MMGIHVLIFIRYSPRLGNQYESYRKHRCSGDWKQQTDSRAYWRGALERFPELAALALKTLEIPLSSIAAERAFAMARTIDVAARRRMTWDTFSREVYVHVNKPWAYDALKNAYEASKSRV